jgi:DNA-binding response OmpR family regulator
MVKILAMDNEEDILSSLRTILEKENYKVTCVTTGQRAIKEVKVGKYDLVILDIMMPDLSGWDVFSQIMKINPIQKIIFLSVLEISPERKKELEKYGNVEYIVKPFDRSIFVERVKSMLSVGKKK